VCHILGRVVAVYFLHLVLLQSLQEDIVVEWSGVVVKEWSLCPIQFDPKLGSLYMYLTLGKGNRKG